MKFEGSCLKQNITSSKLRNVVHLFIVYELDTCSRDLSTDFTIGVSLFGAFKFTDNADLDKYRYSDYGNGFEACPGINC